MNAITLYPMGYDSIDAIVLFKTDKEKDKIIEIINNSVSRKIDEITLALIENGFDVIHDESITSISL